ncbi:MAG: hypothetical protein ABIB97_01885 [Patescibacteria group bacterium]
MDTFTSWGDALNNSLDNIWTGFLDFLPKFVGAVLIFVIGWIVSVLIGNLVSRVVKYLWVDRLLQRIKVKEAVEKAGIKVDIAKSMGLIVKWFLIFVFLTAATDVVGWTEVTLFLRKFVGYLPNVIIAVIIFTLGLMFANWVQSVVKKSISAYKLLSPELVSAIAKWSIVVFSLLAALIQLRVAPSLLQTLFTGIVAMIAIAGGLAFGLGGKEYARNLLEKVQKDVHPKE